VNRGRISVPQFLVNVAFELIRQEVTSRADFDPLDLTPLAVASEATCPALFGVAADDTFVLPHHTQDLFNAWRGERVLRVFDGGHNGVRPVWFLEAAASFLVQKLWCCECVKHHVAATARPIKKGVSDASEDRFLGHSDSATSLMPELMSSDTWVPGERTPEDLREEFGRPSDDTPLDPEVLIKELNNIGFTESFAAKAASKCRTIGEAVKWLLKRDDVVCEIEEAPPASRSTFAAGKSSKASEEALDPLLVGPPGASLEEQLQYLGFEKTKCRTAASKCTDLAAAAEWLAANNATVAL
jgi:hypothetical protein